MATTDTKNKTETQVPSPNKHSSDKTGQETTHDPLKRIPEKEIYTWRAASRPFKRRDREFWITIGAIAAIFGLILFLIEGVMPVLLIIALVFLFYILSTVEPETITYAITNMGVKIADRTTPWE